MDSTYFKAIAGTDEVSGQGEVVVFAGGFDLDTLVDELADGIGALMVEHAPSPRFGGEIRVVWMPEKLPAETRERGLDELRTRLCDQILRLELMPARDVKLSFQVGV